MRHSRADHLLYNFAFDSCDRIAKIVYSDRRWHKIMSTTRPESTSGISFPASDVESKIGSFLQSVTTGTTTTALEVKQASSSLNVSRVSSISQVQVKFMLLPCAANGPPISHSTGL